LVKRVIAISNHGFMLGGGEKSFLDLISHLPKSWEVLAIVPEEGELSGLLSQNRIDTEAINLPSIKPWNVLNILTSLKNYFNLFHKFRPALIYANGSRAAFYGGLTGRILRIPVIWHCRIADPDIYLDPLLCRLSTRIIANSQATAKRFKPHFQHKVRTIYNGIDIGWLQDEAVQKPDFIQHDWKVILVIARISKSKRHDLALSAFEKIATSDPKFHLVCIGAEDQLDSEGYNYLMKSTKLSRFSDRVHWIGQVADVRPWYRSADILLFPSENEAFGRVVVEAMACGIPVVATRSGGVPEIITDGQDGLLVPVGNSDEMAKAMLQIISNRPLRDKIIQNDKQRANDFSLDTHVKKMEMVFEETINE
jgi:glycosyltransferase involved in cell wall biosynthesis